MIVWKPLTEAEKKFNKKNPQHAIKPHKGIYIDEKKYPEEAAMWEALGWKNMTEIIADPKEDLKVITC